MTSPRSRSASQAIPITVYEDESAHDFSNDISYDDEEEEEDFEDEDMNEHEDGLDDEDPFSASELSQLSNQEGSTVIRSIEFDQDYQEPVKHATHHRSSHSHDLIHLDDHFEAAENAHADSGYDAPSRVVGSPKSRMTSDGWKSMPEEMQYYKSPLPGQKMLMQRSPLSATRSHLEEPMSPSPVAHRQSLLSSPTRHINNSPFQSSAQQSPTRNTPITPRERPVFRNPSSVRAMQMASPPPFSTPSPKSARHRRQQSEAARSRQGTPTRHPNPNKEYPLVLLHCTLTPLPSTFHFSPSVLEAILPEEKLRDVALLKEKLGLGTTVLERGVLIPHPQEDYELLEERILESLELKKPRVGACGHFLPEDNATVHDYDEDDCHDGCEAKCEDCNRHVHPSLLEDGEFSRRWDVRIYAANGLMRAGAWSAAWREMEKVDVEVGIWFSDSMRRKLEEKAREEMQGGVVPSIDALQLQTPVPDLPNMVFPDDVVAQTLVPEDVQSVHSVPASTATTSARPRASEEHDQVKNDGSTTVEPKLRPTEEKLPLSLLLQNYLMHLLTQKKDMVLGAIVIILGLVLARSSLVSTPGSNIAPHPASSPSGTLQSMVSSTALPTSSGLATPVQIVTETVTALASATAAPTSTVYLTSTVTWTTTETVSVTASGLLAAHCTPSSLPDRLPSIETPAVSGSTHSSPEPTSYADKDDASSGKEEGRNGTHKTSVGLTDEL